jgi:protein-tyrosine phosphatase
MNLGSLFSERTPSGTFTILTVCTGNICRSPLAESLLRSILGGLPVQVESAGTQALVGAAPPEETQRIGLDLGATDIAGHRSRPLTVEQLQSADLVLAMSREHRAAVVELLPSVARRAFTIREFARLAVHVTEDDLALRRGRSLGDQLAGAVEAAAQLRGTLNRPGDATDDDVVDPFRQSMEVYGESTRQLIPAINSTAALLRASVKIEGTA